MRDFTDTQSPIYMGKLMLFQSDLSCLIITKRLCNEMSFFFVKLTRFIFDIVKCNSFLWIVVREYFQVKLRNNLRGTRRKRYRKGM